MNEIEIVKRSYGRCLGNGDFFDRFYEIFLQSNPRVKEKFLKTDFEEQKKLIRHGINCMIMYSSQNLAGETCLARIKETHGKNKLNIEPIGLINYQTLIIVIWCLYSSIYSSSGFYGTIGKQKMGLKIVDKNGQRLSFLKAFLRFFMGFLLFGLIVGMISIIFTNKRQGLHDILLSTVVLKRQ